MKDYTKYQKFYKENMRQLPDIIKEANNEAEAQGMDGLAKKQYVDAKILASIDQPNVDIDFANIKPENKDVVVGWLKNNKMTSSADWNVSADVHYANGVKYEQLLSGISAMPCSPEQSATKNKILGVLAILREETSLKHSHDRRMQEIAHGAEVKASRREYVDWDFSAGRAAFAMADVKTQQLYVDMVDRPLLGYNNPEMSQDLQAMETAVKTVVENLPALKYGEKMSPDTVSRVLGDIKHQYEQQRSKSVENNDPTFTTEDGMEM